MISLIQYLYCRSMFSSITRNMAQALPSSSMKMVITQPILGLKQNFLQCSTTPLVATLLALEVPRALQGYHPSTWLLVIISMEGL